MNPCKLTEDLMPLYVDGALNEETKEFVKQHLAECEACRKLHEQMNRTVQIITSRQNTQASFKRFQRRMLLKRSLLIALCVLVSLALLTVILYRPLETYLAGHNPARTAPFNAHVSRLSDGSIYLALQYTEEDVYVNTQRVYPHPEDEKTLCIELGWNRLNTWDNSLKNGGARSIFIVLTEESAGLYDLDDYMPELYTRPYHRIILVGADGERTLWQDGDDIPAASEREEDMNWMPSFTPPPNPFY